MKVKNLTLDTVRNAVIDNNLDVNATNASALRKIIGSGSNQTIQKHLETLRSQQKKPVLTEKEQEPVHDVEMPESIKSELNSALTSAFNHINANLKASVNADAKVKEVQEQAVNALAKADEEHALIFEKMLHEYDLKLAALQSELDRITNLRVEEHIQFAQLLADMKPKTAAKRTKQQEFQDAILNGR
jgi:transketolase